VAKVWNFSLTNDKFPNFSRFSRVGGHAEVAGAGDRRGTSHGNDISVCCQKRKKVGTYEQMLGTAYTDSYYTYKY